VQSCASAAKPPTGGAAPRSALLGARWRSLGDPCTGGPAAARTFMAQASFALAVPGAPGRFLLMADRWNPERLGVSRRGPATLLP